MTFKVFVAYGQEEAKKVAVRLAKYLHRAGIDVFVASSDLKWMQTGDEFEKILENLNQSDIVIPVCCDDSKTSTPLQEEMDIAESQEKIIMPFIKERVPPPFNLGSGLWISRFGDNPWRKHRQLLLEVLKKAEEMYQDKAIVVEESQLDVQ